MIFYDVKEPKLKCKPFLTNIYNNFQTFLFCKSVCVYMFIYRLHVNKHKLILLKNGLAFCLEDFIFTFLNAGHFASALTKVLYESVIMHSIHNKL